jgi:hypothetical protein
VNWNRFFYLFHHLVPYDRDSGLFVWDFWWMKQSVVHLSNPYFSHSQAAPVGVPLAFHTLLPLPGLVMTPFTLLFGPGFSYNLLSVLAPGLTAYAMYRVARLWVPTQVAAIAAGAFYGLSTMMTFNAWYEINLALGAACIPVALEAAVRLSRKTNWRQAVIFGVVLGAALLIDQESTIMAAVVAGLALLPWLFRRSIPVLLKLRSVVFAGIAFGVVASPQLIETLIQGRAGDATMSMGALAGDYLNSGAPLLQMFAPSPRTGAFGLHPLEMLYYHTGPQSLTLVCYGWVVIVLAVLGLIVCWRRRGAKLLTLLWAAATVSALGTSIYIDRTTKFTPFPQVWNHIKVSLILPYTWIIRLPGLSSFREADRITEIGMVAAALLAAAGVDWLRRNASPALLVIPLVLAVLEMGSAGIGLDLGLKPAVSMPLSRPKLDGPIAADHSNSIVLDLPLGIRGGVPVKGEGAAYDPQVQIQAVNDGHPRSAALISRLPPSVLDGIFRHPFYLDLIQVESQMHIAGGIPVAHPTFPHNRLNAAQFAVAHRDAVSMDIGWAILWEHKPQLIRYLEGTGFRFDYKVDGVSVYRLSS